MVKIGCSSLFFWEYEFDEIVDIYNDIGLKYMEFVPENPAFWKKRNDLDYVLNVKKILSKLNITVHSPYIELNPSSNNENIREITLKETLWAIELSKLLNSKFVTIHAGKRPTKRVPTLEEYVNFYEYLKKCEEYALINDISLCLENSTKKVNHICYLVCEMEKTLENFKNLNLTLDFAHARGDSTDFVKVLYKYIKNVHISGVNGKDHYPISSSKIDFSKPLNDLLYKYKYNGVLNLELNDLIYKKTLSKFEKIEILVNEVSYIEKMLE
ncbi:Xylose isomerase domain protein TIM barrel [Methanococcus vannielii SB]|uniref:Xylose isomerase domain protein TIM barrel n=1 Tax=Methanococcus vannielii (strain ATCC 35089 / DSM 1224 / JCM 13029 / OCM 148 / SB) TaxID=406327 RepID=A6USB6_METVS|nr:sugar phosphate isomerase/epimerase [Methanococcus vannielii]ABR55388.1 Xylose isomerase domain protein TIM barrel [Methanococcus vannielii SB]